MAANIKTDQQKQDFIALALTRFQACADAEQKTRSEALADIEFSLGDQWPQGIADGQAVKLTINRMPQFIRQVTNEQRQQRPAINVNPVGDGADVETAEVFQGIIRHIEVQSDAEVAYDHAFEQMVRGGFGYWRIINTDKGELLIKRIKNQFTVYFDPNCQEPDYSDAEYAFIVADIPRKEFEAEFKDAEAASLESYGGIGDLAKDWLDKQNVRIAEYFYLMDGKVCWAKITALDVLEETTWPGKYIPIIPVLGDDVEVNGKRHLAGLIRHSKDAQRMYNYWVSKATERIALEPKIPWLAEIGTLEGLEDYWKQANVRNMEVLPWNSKGGTLPQPSRQAVQSDISGFQRLIAQADNDLKATTGLYDASLGQQGPESSGKAILARQKQGDIATLNFSDNLARSIRFCGRQLVDLIPKVYTKSVVQRIINPDRSVNQVGIYNSAEGGSAEDFTEAQGISKIYDVGVGTYDVTVDVGPSYQTKRQEASAMMLELMAKVPVIAQAAPDLLVREMDIPNAKALADRINKTLPPQLQDGDQNDPEVQLQKTQGQLQQLAQQHDLLTKALTDATQTIQQKQIERQTQLDLAQVKAQTETEIARLKIEAGLAQAEVTTKAQIQSERESIVADVMSQLRDHVHEAVMAQMQHQNAMEQGQQSADNAQIMAAQNAAQQGAQPNA